MTLRLSLVVRVIAEAFPKAGASVAISRAVAGV
jgi:hypothetical protein